ACPTVKNECTYPSPVGASHCALANDETLYDRWSMNHRETKPITYRIVRVHNCMITSRNAKPALARPGGCPRPSRGACPTVKNECTYPSPVGASHCALANDETLYDRWSMNHRETKPITYRIVRVHNCMITSRNAKPALARPGGCPRPSRGACPTVKNECTYPSPVGASHCALANDETLYDRWSMNHRETKPITYRIVRVHNSIITSRNGNPALARPGGCPRPSRGACPTVKNECTYPSPVGASHCALANDETLYDRWSMNHRETKPITTRIVRVHTCIITSRNGNPALDRPGGCPRHSGGACPTVKNECTYPSPVGASHCARCQMTKRCIIDDQRNIAKQNPSPLESCAFTIA